MNTAYLETIKRFEGFTAKAKWDIAQNTNGYGTKALYSGEVIDKSDADRRFATEIACAKTAVARFAPGLDEGTAAALTSLTFNAGPGWMRSGLGAAIKAGDLEVAKQVFVQYVHAGGQRLAGLEARRAVEAQWIGQPQTAVSVDAPEGSNVRTFPVVSAEDKDVVPARGEVGTAVVQAANSEQAARMSFKNPEASDALVKSFFFETIAIMLAFRRGAHERDDNEP